MMQAVKNFAFLNNPRPTSKIYIAALIKMLQISHAIPNIHPSLLAYTILISLLKSANRWNQIIFKLDPITKA